MENIVISHIDISSPKYQQVWDLRDAILRRPLGMSLKNDDLSWDNDDIMFIAEADSRVIGCVMLHPVTDECMKLRQMAVYDEWQGRGIGAMLVRAAEEYIRSKGYRKITLHARKTALGFYSILDYDVLGNEFTEVGIPHYLMEKSI